MTACLGSNQVCNLQFKTLIYGASSIYFRLYISQSKVKTLTRIFSTATWYRILNKRRDGMWKYSIQYISVLFQVSMFYLTTILYSLTSVPFKGLDLCPNAQAARTRCKTQDLHSMFRDQLHHGMDPDSFSFGKKWSSC